MVYLLEVGEGDSTLMAGPDFTILVDAGCHDRSDVVAHLREACHVDRLVGRHPSTCLSHRQLPGVWGAQGVAHARTVTDYEAKHLGLPRSGSCSASVTRPPIKTIYRWSTPRHGTPRRGTSSISCGSATRPSWRDDSPFDPAGHQPGEDTFLPEDKDEDERHAHKDNVRE